MQKDGLVAQPGVPMFKPLQTLQFWSDQAENWYTYASNSNLKVVKMLCCSVVNYGFYAIFLSERYEAENRHVHVNGISRQKIA